MEKMTKARFVAVMRAERDRWEALLATVGPSEMESPGVAGDWSVRDIIVHVTAYERGLAEWLEAAMAGQVLAFAVLDDPDVDVRNTVILQERQGWSLDEIQREAAQVFERLLTLVEGLSEEELLDPERVEWYVRPRWGQQRARWQCIADDSTGTTSRWTWFWSMDAILYWTVIVGYRYRKPCIWTALMPT